MLTLFCNSLVQKENKMLVDKETSAYQPSKFYTVTVGIGPHTGLIVYVVMHQYEILPIF